MRRASLWGDVVLINSSLWRTYIATEAEDLRKGASTMAWGSLFQGFNQGIAVVSAVVGLLSAILALILSARSIMRMGEERARREAEDRRREEELRVLKLQTDLLKKQSEAVTRESADLRALIEEVVKELQAPVNAEIDQRHRRYAEALKTVVENVRLGESDVALAKKLVLKEKLLEKEVAHRRIDALRAPLNPDRVETRSFRLGGIRIGSGGERSNS
jgi:hypothetical protein